LRSTLVSLGHFMPAAEWHDSDSGTITAQIWRLARPANSAPSGSPRTLTKASRSYARSSVDRRFVARWRDRSPTWTPFAVPRQASGRRAGNPQTSAVGENWRFLHTWPRDAARWLRRAVGRGHGQIGYRPFQEHGASRPVPVAARGYGARCCWR